MKDLFYLGVQSQLVKPELLKTPSAPANYKDPAKIHEYVTNKKLEMRAEAASAAVLSSAARIVCMNDDGDMLLDTSVDKTKTLPAIKFLRFVETVFPYLFHDEMIGADSRNKPQRFVGLFVNEALRMIAADLFSHIAKTGDNLKVPARMWYSPLVTTDPMDALLKFSARFLDVSTLATHFGIGTEGYFVESEDSPSLLAQAFEIPADDQCRIAKDITHRLQLFGN